MVPEVQSAYQDLFFLIFPPRCSIQGSISLLHPTNQLCECINKQESRGPKRRFCESDRECFPGKQKTGHFPVGLCCTHSCGESYPALAIKWGTNLDIDSILTERYGCVTTNWGKIGK